MVEPTSPASSSMRPGSVQLRGFRAAQLGADDRRLGIDVAELLGAQAARVGIERAVAAAVAAMPVDVLQASLPMLQPLAVSKATRAAVKKAHGKAFWTDLRTALAERIGAPEYELTKLQRISAGQIITVACAGFLILVAPRPGRQLVGDQRVVRETRTGPTCRGSSGSSLFTYVTGAWSLMGCVPIRLPLIEATQVMFAQAFLNRFTPANAGGMALRIRYLQHHGIDLTFSAASIGLTSAASGVMQVLLLVGFGLWAGSTGELDFSLPDMEVIAWIIAGVLVLAGIVYLFPWGRKLYGKLFESLRKAGGELLQLARSPMKMLELFGGAGPGQALHDHVLRPVVPRLRRHRPVVPHPRLRLHDGEHGGVGRPDARRHGGHRGRPPRRAHRAPRRLRHRAVDRHRVPPHHLLAPGDPRLVLPPAPPLAGNRVISGG